MSLASPQARIGLAVALPVALVAGLAALGLPSTTDLPAPTVPAAFLDWEGEPFDDGLNHYLVRLGAASDGVLRLGDGGDLHLTRPADAVGVDDLGAALDGDGNTTVDTAVDLLRARGDIDTVRSIGYDAYAVSGTIGSAELAAIPGVERVDRDPALRAATVDELYPSQWALENDGTSPEPWGLEADADVDAPEGWHRTRGAGVIVAVIDSGVDENHPDLAANLWRNPGETCGNGIDDDANGYVDDCHGWDFANGDGSLEDLNGHGTHVAGIIAAEANNGIGIAGVAYEAEVMVLKIGDETPALSAAVEAIAYAEAMGARIVNASWVVDDPAAAEYLDPALSSTRDAGMIVVTGAGNQAVDLDLHQLYPASAPHPHVITVGASTPLDTRAAYSSWGSTSVDLFAPGEHIVSTVPGGYGAYSGTSMAAPFVSGAAALLWSATPEATAAEVKGALLDRSDGPNDGVENFRDLAVSDGRLNIDRAIYSRLFQPSFMYSFRSFNDVPAATEHEVSILAKTVDPWIAAPQTPVRYRGGLYVPYDGEVRGVIGHEITHWLGGAPAVAVTDVTGRALLGDVWEREERPALVQDGDVVPLRMTLPAGTYAFVMEAVDVSDPSSPVVLGDPSAVFFVVGVDGSVDDMPATPVLDVTSTTVADGAATTIGPDGSPSGPAETPGDPGDGFEGDGTSPTVPDGEGTEDLPADATTAAPDSGDEGDESPPTSVSPTTPTTIVVTPSTSVAPEPTDGDEPTSPTSTLPGSTTTEPPPSSGAPDEPEVGEESGMRITDVDPAEGPVRGGTSVTITGDELPDDPVVFFGDRRAEVVAAAPPSFVLVATPPGAAGLVDVSVVAGDGTTATRPGAFRYLEPEVGPTAPTTMAPTPDGDAAPTSTLDPSVTTSAVIADDDLDDWVDDTLVTPDGLVLGLPAPDAAIGNLPATWWAGALCDEPVCPGWVLEGP